VADLLAQARGGDAGAQLQAEQRQHGARQRVDRDRLAGAGDNHADHAVLGDQREDQPVLGRRVERVLDQPRGGFPEHDRRAGGDRERPGFGLERQLVADGCVGHVAAQDRLPVGVREIQRRGVEVQRGAHLLQRAGGQGGQLAGAHQRA
jgi:hypothetical protein